MDILAFNEHRIYGAVSVDAPEQFVSPFPGELFPCLIWDHDGRFDGAERTALIRRLLDAGCRFAVCGGENCEVWHDTIDEEYALRRLDVPQEPRDAEVLMTTWHQGDSPDEVASFFVYNMDLRNHQFRKYVVLHVGTSEAKQQLDDAVQRHARESAM
jgi:hypothetical protein